MPEQWLSRTHAVMADADIARLCQHVEGAHQDAGLAMSRGQRRQSSAPLQGLLSMLGIMSGLAGTVAPATGHVLQVVLCFAANHSLNLQQPRPWHQRAAHSSTARSSCGQPA